MNSKHNTSGRFVGLIIPGMCLLLTITTATSCSARANAELAEDIRRCEVDLFTGKGSEGYIRDVAPARYFSWKEAADANTPEGLWLVGRCYNIGVVVEKDLGRAVDFYRQAAEQEYALAQIALGYMYAEGLGVPQSDELAFRWYRNAAGHALAQYNLGCMYEKGQGVPQSDELAARWFGKAAEQDCALAQAILGAMYADGRGVPQDDKIAVEWYRKAAEQDYALAQALLGVMYAEGRGVPKNDQLAVGWYQKAAEQGEADAQVNLGFMYAKGRGVPQSDQLAVEWYRKAAEQGSALAQYNIGLAYAEGLGVPQNDQLAVAWYRKAADQGFYPAQNNLRFMAANGRGGAQDASPSGPTVGHVETPSEKFGRMVGIPNYQGVGNAPEGSPQWWSDQTENSPVMRHMLGIPEE